MTGAEVVVVSRVVLDEIAEGGDTRVVLGGSGFWAAYGAALVSDAVAPACRVGPDFVPFREVLRDLGISEAALVDAPWPTSRTRITYPAPQERHEAFVGGWSAHLRMRTGFDEVPPQVAAAPAIYVFRDIPAGFWSPVLERRADGALVMWEMPGVVCAKGLTGEVGDLIAQVDVLSLNEQEAGDLLGPAVQTPEAVLARLADLGPAVVVLRRGARGAVAIGHGRLVAVSSAAADVVDPTGAGNAFSGALLASLSAGAGLAEAMCTASAVAGTAIEQIGPPSGREAARARMRALAETVEVSERIVRDEMREEKRSTPA